MNKELARKLIDAGIHFGHGSSRWNPKMKPYIFAKRGMIHIIDVKETLKGLLIAKKLLTQVVSSGKDVVFVGTKRQAQKAVKSVAADTNMHFIANRWLGGTLTNFQTIRSRVKRMEELEARVADGTIEAESKKMGSMLKRELGKIQANLDGVRAMHRLPGCIVVVDTKKEKIALREAAKLGIPTVGIIDTDSDPDQVDVAIPGNDDSIKAIELIMKELCESVKQGKTLKTNLAAASESQIKGRSKRRAMGSAKEEATAKEAAPAPEATPVAPESKEEAPEAPAAE